MKPLSIILLVGVFLRHDAANWLASSSSFSPAAWFYVLGAAWELILCAILLRILCEYRWTIWRGLADAALVIGIIESAQMLVCRLSIADIARVPMGVNLCDYCTGLPVGGVTTALYVLIICWQFGRHIHERAS